MSRATEIYKNSRLGRLEEEKDKYKYYCYCGHAVHIYPKGKYATGSVICGWCKRRVFSNPEEQKKAVEKYKKEDFRIKMLRTMKGVK